MSCFLWYILPASSSLLPRPNCSQYKSLKIRLIGKFYVDRKNRSTAFKALELWNVSPGCNWHSFIHPVRCCCLTKHCTILEPQNMCINISELRKILYSTDFEVRRSSNILAGKPMCFNKQSIAVYKSNMVASLCIVPMRYLQSLFHFKEERKKGVKMQMQKVHCFAKTSSCGICNLTYLLRARPSISQF